jgi:hypothetical protein
LGRAMIDVTITESTKRTSVVLENRDIRAMVRPRLS